jgi:hypothetical protein
MRCAALPFAPSAMGQWSTLFSGFRFDFTTTQMHAGQSVPGSPVRQPMRIAATYHAPRSKAMPMICHGSSPTWLEISSAFDYLNGSAL